MREKVVITSAVDINEVVGSGHTLRIQRVCKLSYRGSTGRAPLHEASIKVPGIAS
jgi:hypothetical protein